ncbi:MAG: PhnD/SsuA/transferrin family substrate-binding protein [Rhodobacteraceae bacterium]|nr:PhnD/SsuA/transferrin family substrate-binding protein [Paracoccaceae bacterium]
MIASLPMYDRPEVRGATDRFWQAIRAALGDGPETLHRKGDAWEDWQSPDLLLSQTCGFPYRKRLHGKVNLVATPSYDLPCNPPGYYHSAMVVRIDDRRATLTDFADAVLARNDPLSQSGWAAPEHEAAALGFSFRRRTINSGSHQASARMVAEGGADIAALDAVSWAMIERHDSFAGNLRVLARTRPTPGLPYVTAATRDPAPLAAAIAAAIPALSQSDRDDLLLTGLVRIPAQAYLDVWTPATG